MFNTARAETLKRLVLLASNVVKLKHGLMCVSDVCY